MSSSEKKERTGKKSSVIATEGPLSEKDEQARSIEQAKQLQKEAAEKWEREKKKKVL